MKLSKKEVAMVLAGLRLLQLNMGGAARSVPDSIRDILNDADIWDGAPPKSIDRLCEKINLGGTTG